MLYSIASTAPECPAQTSVSTAVRLPADGLKLARLSKARVRRARPHPRLSTLTRGNTVTQKAISELQQQMSKDCPDLQREFANSRGWRFRLASHGGGEYMVEQSVLEGAGNMPGAVVYERDGDGDGDGDGDAIYRKSACVFGPGDQYCTMWSLLGLAGMGEDEWTPQFRYWRQPAQLDDGGENVQS